MSLARRHSVYNVVNETYLGWDVISASTHVDPPANVHSDLDGLLAASAASLRIGFVLSMCILVSRAPVAIARAVWVDID